MPHPGQEYRYALEWLALKHLQGSRTESLNSLPPETLSAIQAKTLQRFLEEMMWGIGGDLEIRLPLDEGVEAVGRLSA